MSVSSVVKTTAGALALGFCLHGCAQKSSVEVASLETRQPVEMRLAIGTFVEFCYRSAPDFLGLEEKALSGSYIRALNGWLEHSDYSLDLVTRDHQEYRTCQFAFTSSQSEVDFEGHMKGPFSAREISTKEFRRLFDQKGYEMPLGGVTRKTFVSKTEFEDRVPAVFYGFVFDAPGVAASNSYFGLILQTNKN